MYNTLAKFYDKFMGEQVYEKWLSFVLEGIKGSNCGVDFGCGTGKFTLEMIRRGLDVYGVDLSPQMLAAAEYSAKSKGIKARFVLGDIRNFTFMKKVEFITALCDTFNYIKSPLPVFKHLYNNLKSGGKVMFDVSSEYKLKNILGGQTYSETLDDITYIWHNSLFKNRVEMELTFFEKVDNGSDVALYKKSIDCQTQYIHKTDDILQMLDDAGFSAESYGNFAKNPPKATDERVHFIAIKH